jgi:hypothetical protein
MTTDRQTEANRANAKRSTGPRTAPGRARASRNSFRHGLAVGIAHDPKLSANAERLAQKIMGADNDSHRLRYARIAAEAEIDLQRVRKARTQLINMLARRFGNPDELASRAQAFLQASPQLLKLDRYERRALSRRKRAIRQLAFA